MESLLLHGNEDFREQILNREEKRINNNKLIKKLIGRFSMKVSLNELTNNQSETKSKINSQIKFFSAKITKNRFKGPTP